MEDLQESHMLTLLLRFIDYLSDDPKISLISNVASDKITKTIFSYMIDQQNSELI